MNQRMRAVVVRAPGAPLEVCDLARPSVAPGLVLVRVRAAGVCHRDLIDRAGEFPFMKRPVVTGHEFAGEVVAVGEGAPWSVGDRVTGLHHPSCGACEACRGGDEPRCIALPLVFGLTVDGSYAEYLLAHPGALVPVPASIDFARAAFLHCTAAVALRALRRRAGLAAGETVLVTGASGGVGIHALQIAKLLGARVVAVTSREAKAAALREAGADEVIVIPAGAPFHREALAATGGGAHVALDCVGAPTMHSSLRALRAGGRLVVVGNVTAARVEVNPGWLILREASVMGSASASRRDVEEVLAWVEGGRLRPVIAVALPLDQAAEAQRRVAAGEVIGRIVLVP